MFNLMMCAHATWGWGVELACWQYSVVKLRAMGLEAQLHGEAAETNKLK